MTYIVFYTCIVLSLLSIWLGLPDAVAWTFVGIEIGIVVGQALMVIEAFWEAGKDDA